MGNNISSYKAGVDNDDGIVMVVKTLELLLYHVERQQSKMGELIEKLDMEITKEYRRLRQQRRPSKQDKRKSFEDRLSVPGS